jgi:hypothetical protein
MRVGREFYIRKGSVKVADKLSDAVAYLYTSIRGKPSATVFFGKQSKPVADYCFRSDDERTKHVTELFHRRRAHAEKVKANREEDKAFEHSVQVGDIFRTCWGYDQTNVEFFEVVEVRGKFAILRELTQVSESNGYGEDRCVPQSGAYLQPRHDRDNRGLPIRRLIQRGYQDQPRIKIDECRTASPWGNRIAGAVVGGAVSKTSSGWGH